MGEVHSYDDQFIPWPQHQTGPQPPIPGYMTPGFQAWQAGARARGYVPGSQGQYYSGGYPSVSGSQYYSGGYPQASGQQYYQGGYPPVSIVSSAHDYDSIPQNDYEQIRFHSTPGSASIGFQPNYQAITEGQNILQYDDPDYYSHQSILDRPSLVSLGKIGIQSPLHKNHTSIELRESIAKVKTLSLGQAYNSTLDQIAFFQSIFDYYKEMLNRDILQFAAFISTNCGEDNVFAICDDLIKEAKTDTQFELANARAKLGILKGDLEGKRKVYNEELRNLEERLENAKEYSEAANRALSNAESKLDQLKPLQERYASGVISSEGKRRRARQAVRSAFQEVETALDHGIRWTAVNLITWGAAEAIKKALEVPKAIKTTIEAGKNITKLISRAGSIMSAGEQFKEDDLRSAAADLAGLAPWAGPIFPFMERSLDLSEARSSLKTAEANHELALNNPEGITYNEMKSHRDSLAVKAKILQNRVDCYQDDIENLQNNLGENIEDTKRKIEKAKMAMQRLLKQMALIQILRGELGEKD